MLQANFHTTLAGEAMVTLIYHKKLDEEWKIAARELRDALGSLPGCTSGTVQARCPLNEQPLMVAVVGMMYIGQHQIGTT